MRSPVTATELKSRQNSYDCLLTVEWPYAPFKGDESYVDLEAIYFYCSCNLSIYEVRGSNPLQILRPVSHTEQHVRLLLLHLNRACQ
jgi:hypothetical protein